MLTAWHTTGFGEVGGPITESYLFGNCLGHPMHGGTASRRQAVPNSNSVSHMVRMEKSHKTGNTVSIWLTTACNQGGKTRKNLHF